MRVRVLICTHVFVCVCKYMFARVGERVCASPRGIPKLVPLDHLCFLPRTESYCDNQPSVENLIGDLRALIA